MFKHWVAAFRFRTLPLALACIGMGSFLAAYYGAFSLVVCLLSLLTTLFLQVLSNLANDYGDSVHGADSLSREGPKRAVQQGVITKVAMKRAIYVLGGLSFISGFTLLYLSLDFGTPKFYAFLALGILAIAAAIAYTNGKRPYGYMGLGDLFVFLFFGIVGVAGTFLLHTDSLPLEILLPASACGLLATGVLNVNNIRDIDSDKLAGKRSIPVRLGMRMAKFYHVALIVAAWVAIISFTLLAKFETFHLLVLLSLPLFASHLVRLRKSVNAVQIDPLLKQLALATLFFVLCFGIGILL
ncbi:MAG: 1,4-dihydroxy-2-naphthoate octaprenyltransferase [Marivirga sp.]|jgi:1,4-dihydroxy-2-naphthoate octaprenyltransferase